MNCDQYQDLIQQRLDGRDIVAAPEIERHILDCARCSSLESASRRLSAGLRLMMPLTPPPGFSDQLVECVLADQRAQRRQSRLRTALYAMAACLLVSTAAAGIYKAGWLTGPSNQQKPLIVNNIPKPETTPTPTVRGTVSDAGTALASLTTRTADETVGQTRLLVPMVTGPSLDELDMPPAFEPTKSYLEAGQGVSVALEPVTNSAQRAINLFRHDLPHVERSQKR